MKHRTLASFAALAAVLALEAPGGAQPAHPGPPAGRARIATLAVSGIGSTSQAPDRATISFRIETSDDQATRATSANATIAYALTARLNALGVSGAAIKTASFGIVFNPRPAQPNPAFAQRYGYVVDKDVSVTVDRTDTVGTLIDAGVAAGVTSVNSVSFSLRDPRAAYRTALAAAMDDARSQAEALAAAAHLRLGPVVSISAGTSAPPIRPLLMARVATSPAPVVPTTIEPGDLTTNATVSAVYQIGP
jgi:uncharacterized protein